MSLLKELSDKLPANAEISEVKFEGSEIVIYTKNKDFFKNRRTVQSIYNADYQFAQPPFTPTLTAVPGDERVVLSWDTLAIASFYNNQADIDRLLDAIA